jgi:hypothetical protein
VLPVTDPEIFVEVVMAEETAILFLKLFDSEGSV